MGGRVDRKKWIAAMIMGIFTVVLCLVIADHWIGLSQTPAHRTRENLAHIILYGGLVGLPILFYPKTTWPYTLLNLPLYFILYFPIAEIAGSAATHFFLRYAGGFIAFPDAFGAGITAVYFWSVQSVVFLVLWGVQRLQSAASRKDRS